MGVKVGGNGTDFFKKVGQGTLYLLVVNIIIINLLIACFLTRPTRRIRTWRSEEREEEKEEREEEEEEREEEGGEHVGYPPSFTSMERRGRKREVNMLGLNLHSLS